MMITMLLEFIESIAMESFFFFASVFMLCPGWRGRTNRKANKGILESWEDLFLFHSSPVYP